MSHFSLSSVSALVLSLTLFSAQAEMTLSSKAVPANSVLSNAQVFNGFGCSGDNLSPDLHWSPGPEGTKSYAVTVYDPDAPTGSGWWHWLVYNLPQDTLSLAAGAGAVASTQLPSGAVQGRTDFGTAGFGGACPPEGHGPHRYIFTVFALSTEKIELPADASGALVGYMLNANMLEKASFTATYER